MDCVKHAFSMGMILPQENKIGLDGKKEGMQKIFNVTMVCGPPQFNHFWQDLIS